MPTENDKPSSTKLDQVSAQTGTNSNKRFTKLYSVVLDMGLTNDQLATYMHLLSQKPGSWFSVDSVKDARQATYKGTKRALQELEIMKLLNRNPRGTGKGWTYELFFNPEDNHNPTAAKDAYGKTEAELSAAGKKAYAARGATPVRYRTGVKAVLEAVLEGDPRALAHGLSKTILLQEQLLAPPRSEPSADSVPSPASDSSLVFTKEQVPFSGKDKTQTLTTAEKEKMASEFTGVIRYFPEGFQVTGDIASWLMDRLPQHYLNAAEHIAAANGIFTAELILFSAIEGVLAENCRTTAGREKIDAGIELTESVLLYILNRYWKPLKVDGLEQATANRNLEVDRLRSLILSRTNSKFTNARAVNKHVNAVISRAKSTDYGQVFDYLEAPVPQS